MIMKKSICLLFPSPEPSVSCIDDLDFFKDFENEFPAIVYNDALTSKLDFSTEPALCPQYIDELNLKDETSLSKCDEKEQNVLYFNDLYPFNVIYPDDLKSDKHNDDDKIDIKQSSRDMSVIPLPNVINTNVGTIRRNLGFGIRRIDPCIADLAIRKSTIWYTLKNTMFSGCWELMGKVVGVVWRWWSGGKTGRVGL
nr:hypothetical protein [Tanacetum cinerariifolium]